MSWVAIVPFKGSADRKTRLAAQLDGESRQQLSHDMFLHVWSVLESHPEISNLALLSDEAPSGWQGRLIRDSGRGLNTELGHAATAIGGQPLLIIHADLPLLSGTDVSALLAAENGDWAIAPDRANSGTNALALRDARAFSFAFGPDSFRLHLERLKGEGRIISRPGLATDIDTAEDLAAARKLGFSDKYGNR